MREVGTCEDQALSTLDGDSSKAARYLFASFKTSSGTPASLATSIP